MSETADRIVDALSRARLPLEDEKQLQAAIADLLSAAGVPHRREEKIAGGVIDFVVPRSGITHATDWCGIECKIKGGKRAIHRQLKAYCADKRIRELIVATGVPLSLPLQIEGKPVAIVELGRGWL